MPFYHGDWKKDLGVQALNFHDRHVWFEMLMLMHESEQRGLLILNGKPMSHETIARLINLDKQIFEKSLTSIIENGVCSVREDGTIFSRKMIRDEEISAKRSISGLKGGNPNLLNQKSKHHSYANAVNVNVIEDDIDIKNKKKVLDFLYFDEISLDIWKTKLGTRFDRVCEKLNGWIGEAKGTPEFQDRLIKGQNAPFTIQNWVAKAIINEPPDKPPEKPIGESIREAIAAEERKLLKAKNGDRIRN